MADPVEMTPALMPGTPPQEAMRDAAAAAAGVRAGVVDQPVASTPPWVDEQPWATAPLPGRCPVEGLLSPGELNTAHWLGARHWRGSGVVVELGTFLGAGTHALAAGLNANPLRPGAGTLVVHDLFVAWQGCEQRCHHPYRAGESFRPLFDLNTARWGRLLSVRDRPLPDAWEAGDEAGLQREHFAERRSVESLFVDAAKSPALSRNILRIFGPFLEPGHSVVVQQDGKWTNWWLTLHMHALGAALRPWRHVEDGGSLLYRCVAPVAPLLDHLAGQSPARRFGLDLWDGALRHAREHWPESVMPFLRLQRCLHEVEHGDAAAGAHAALDEIDRWCASPPSRRPEHAQAMAEHARQMAFSGRCAPDLCQRLARRSEDALSLSRWDANAARGALWRMIGRTLAARGQHRIALLGAGRHARDLLSMGWAQQHGLEVRVLLDDRPEQWQAEAGWPALVIGRHAGQMAVDAVVPASDSAEAALVGRGLACGLPADRMFRVYS
jgi:hypothetical protein